MFKVPLLTICFIAISSYTAYGELYQYVDKDGNVHITDNRSNVPTNHVIDKEIKTEAATLDLAFKLSGVKPQSEHNEAADIDKCRMEIDLNVRECQKALEKALASNKQSGAKPSEEDMNAVLFCRHPLIKERLSQQEQANVQAIWSRVEKTKGQITKRELYELDVWSNRFLEDCNEARNKAYSKKELESLEKASTVAGR